MNVGVSCLRKNGAAHRVIDFLMSNTFPNRNIYVIFFNFLRVSRSRTKETHLYNVEQSSIIHGERHQHYNKLFPLNLKAIIGDCHMRFNNCCSRLVLTLLLLSFFLFLSTITFTIVCLVSLKTVSLSKCLSKIRLFFNGLD